MHRLFAALPVPDDVAEQLLQTITPITGARWRTAEHYHVTLAFFGAVSRAHAEDIADALERVSVAIDPLEVNGVGWFGRRAPRALYARVQEQDGLARLSAACRQVGAKFGLRPDDHPFAPHITLAYCRDATLEDVRTWSEDMQLLRTEPFLADRFHLYESFMAPGRQSQYQIQADYLL